MRRVRAVERRSRGPGRGGALAGALCLLAAAATALAQDAAPAPAAPKACVVELRGEIDELTERTFEQRVKRAIEQHAPRVLIVSIDSPGGEVQASRNIAWNLRRRTDVTTVAFVRGWALSGATMVAFGCDLIAVRQDAQIGDVLPIRVDPTGMIAPEVAEKMIAPLRGDLQHLARERGYPPGIAAAMVDPRVELHRLELRDPDTGIIRPHYLTLEELEALSPSERARVVTDEVVCEDGQLLVLSARQAWDMGIASLQAEDEEQVAAAMAEHLSLERLEVVHVRPLWWESLVRIITWWPVKLLLFAVGVVALAFAFASPGTGVPEVTAVLCFGAVFLGSWLLGLADWIELVLFVVGVGLLLFELFTPGFGLAGGAGLLLIGAALLLSFQTFVIPGSAEQWAEMGANAGKTALGAVLCLAALAGTARWLPDIPLLGRVVHGDRQAPGPGLAVAAAGEGAVARPVRGATGQAVTTLRPGGKVSVDDRVYDAVCEDGMVDAGGAVVVLEDRGVELLVGALPEATTLPPARGDGGGAS